MVTRQHIAAINKTDCHGVPIEDLLHGTESQCPECETEISTIRCIQVHESRPGLYVGNELDRILNWPLL